MMRSADIGAARPEKDQALEQALERLLEPLERLSSFGTGPPARAPVREEPPGRHPAPPADVFIPVTLRTSDLRTGARPMVRFTVSTPCPKCRGSGSTEALAGACEPCDGSGFVTVERELIVRIPPGLAEGSDLRVPGEGNVVAPGATPGDLFLRVCFASEPERPKYRRFNRSRPVTRGERRSKK
jgi:hypothetical protein